MPLPPIGSIRDLVRELMKHDANNAFTGILSRYAIPIEDLQRYFRWNNKHYTRTCVHRNADFELLVICYEPGQATSIHDYDSQNAWIHPVMGEVEVERYAMGEHGLRSLGADWLRTGSPDLFRTGSAIHRFVNHGPARAVTLNLYAKPLSRWHVYEAGSSKARTAPPGPRR